MERLPNETLRELIEKKRAIIEAYGEENAPVSDWLVFTFLNELREYRNTGLTPEKIPEVDEYFLDRCEDVNRLNAELEKAKRQLLPCQVGEIVYVHLLTEIEKGNLVYEVAKAKVFKVVSDVVTTCFWVELMETRYKGAKYAIPREAFGETIFLTETEARESLER